ncbi:GNAT family N-acetyltransferase [Janthinobacterium fluminis]|uniref:GNAT family N-acetyltransferase n=1 Tax=Janthinobacterium fluminis TaxID=2987524 RepID=A0ABT5JWI4_9BURK|nr:GNAT family N-acetyltransferase [Janthinobacterium fluminis]MDC8756831.1 GNAT family N-acetyltransferase [Janthinobacterium fluminis]
MNPFLDNIAWHTLVGPHAGFAIGTNEARRYAPGFPSFIAFPDFDKPNFDALLPYTEPGELLYCAGWAGVAPAGWRVEAESILLRMAWNGPMPAVDEAPEAVLLGVRHAAAAHELAMLTRPGPFSPRTIELGDYFGVFDGPRLMAMAGARVCAGGISEISGVCTHPDFQGRGWASRLIAKLLRREMQRGVTPFLRVMRDGVAAQGLYRRMGFRDDGEAVARMISRD